LNHADFIKRKRCVLLLDALVFLAGAVLFLTAVLLFILTWRDRNTAAEERAAIASEQEALTEQRVELDIWQRELQVWHNGLENERRQLEDDRKHLLMLAAPQDDEEPAPGYIPRRTIIAPPLQDVDSKVSQDPFETKELRVKNLKRPERGA